MLEWRLSRANGAILEYIRGLSWTPERKRRFGELRKEIENTQW